MKELILIDGNSLLYRAYFATAAMGNLMVNHDGVPTNGIFGFINMVLKILERKPAAIVVAFDYGKKTFRNELQKDYKATRKETPDELKVQFPIVREYLDACHIAWREVEGYEGDDIIGTLAKYGESNGYEVSIFTGDKDAFQLISDHTTIYRTVKGVSDVDVYNKEFLYNKYQLEPDQIRDFLGLMGDSADNIPGIKGVGEKTALKLLYQYGSVEGIDEHKDEIKGKMGEKVRAGIEDGIKSKEIATILTDVPMDLNEKEFLFEGYESESLMTFYKKYDLNTFLRRMNMPTVKPVQEVEIVTEVPEIKEPSALISSVYDANYHKSMILGYAVYNSTQSFYIAFEDAMKDPYFLAYLKDASKEKYGYDNKRHINASRWNGIEIKGYTFDLQLASYILNPSLKDEIKYVCNYYNYDNVLYDEEVYGKGAKKKVPELKALAAHLVSQAKAVYTLKDEAVKRLKEDDQYALYHDIEVPVNHILADMEFQGAKVEKDVLKDLENDFSGRLADIEKRIYEYAGHTFNISSPKQLGEVLFEEMGLPGSKKTKTGYSTSADVLEKIQYVHPIVEDILNYRTLSKLISTYVTGLQDQIFLDGKIHTIYNQALTSTGRLSSTDPNLQNIPVRSEEGKLIRKAFVPSYDYLVSFDYSQIELRVLAHLSGADSLINAFNNGEDIHAHTASEVFGVPQEEVTKDMRRNAKAVNFGIIYGMSDFGLSQQLNCTVKQAKGFIEKYFENYPEIQSYMNANIDFCKKNGYVSTILNRKRFIPEINERAFMRRELGKRLAMNSPIQGSAADILKIAMIKVDALMKEKGMSSKMILQVHDELIFDVKKEELEDMMDIIDQGMEGACKMKVQLKADGCYASNWYDLK